MTHLINWEKKNERRVWILSLADIKLVFNLPYYTPLRHACTHAP